MVGLSVGVGCGQLRNVRGISSPAMLPDLFGILRQLSEIEFLLIVLHFSTRFFR
jgi:hypothetical protein